MKKILLFSTALVASSATVFAQNTSTVNQNGTSQAAVVSQYGNQQSSTISQVQSTSTNFGNYAITIQGTMANPNTSGPNSISINQNNGSQGNRAAAVQNLTNNTNTAVINQNGGPDGISGGATTATAIVTSAAENGNYAGIAQVGGSNTGVVNQNNKSSSNIGEVWQNGGGTGPNSGTVNQSNNSRQNQGQIFQGYSAPSNLGPAVTGNTALINQGKTNIADQNFTAPGLAEAVSNTAIITQTASTNSATIGQGATISDGNGTSTGRSVSSVAYILQSATGNTADIFQGAQSGESQSSTATISQIGTGNTAEVLQGVLNFGYSINTQGAIVQAGTSSTALVQQGILGTVTNGTATITQTAAANGISAYIYQAFGGNSTSSNDKAGITQGGTGTNYAQIVQGSAPSVGTASSSGNSATITQGDATSNSEALINQGRDAGGNSVNNIASINQVSGSTNAALISQGRAVTVTDGTGNPLVTGVSATNSTATITQTGDNNIGQFYQAGSGHIATLTQTGNTNTSRLYQSGTSQTATIAQTGNGNILDGGIAGSVATQVGASNVLNVMQSQAGAGLGNISHVNQSGTGNTLIITQSSN